VIDRILQFSIRQRVLVVAVTLGVALWGLYTAPSLPIDAVPDITTNQVQINTVAPAFAPLEMERYVTFPIEVAMSNLPNKEEVRSLSQFGLSQVTITFKDNVDLYLARQQVLERLIAAERELPAGVSPELGPVSTGLGEIFQFTVEGEGHTLMERRTLLDWQIKPQLRTVPGVIEVNSFGGLEKQYEVLIDPMKLVSFGLSLRQIIDALQKNNMNAGGAYFERGGEQTLVRAVGLVQSPSDVENVVVSAEHGTPIYIRDIGTVGIGAQVRQGASTRNGRETVMGMVMLLKGENSREVAGRKAAAPPGSKGTPRRGDHRAVLRPDRTCSEHGANSGKKSSRRRTACRSRSVSVSAPDPRRADSFLRNSRCYARGDCRDGVFRNLCEPHEPRCNRLRAHRRCGRDHG